MKIRKNLSLSSQAIAAGERLAAESGMNFSQLVEKQLISAPALAAGSLEEPFWPGPPLKSIRKKGDRRHDRIERKNR